MLTIRGFVLSILFLSSSAFAAIDSNVQLKPVHEALITRIPALAPIEIINTTPPPVKVEVPPPSPNPNMIWIPGYWAWQHDSKQYVWVCGIWRLYPANQTWVQGYWNESNGWWWVAGYWKENGSQPILTSIPPPNLPEENVGTPPNKDSFWAPGYWSYNAASQRFLWLGGSWQPFDLNLVFVQGYWQFHPEGYMFHSAFWDWKLEDRGVAYDCEGSAALIPLTSEVIISRIYFWYPDYAIFFWFHWHCCNDFWHDCWCTPPWWGWSSWWTLNWFDLWGLWWWWGHPGFFGPAWVFPVWFSSIEPPHDEAIHFFNKGPTPLFITPKGIPSFEDWLDAIQEITGQRTPLIPENQLDDAREQVEESMDPTPDSRPSGKGDNQNLDKPSFENEAQPQGTAPVPKVPAPPQITAPIPPKPQGNYPNNNPPDQYVPLDPYVPQREIAPIYPNPPVIIVPPIRRPHEDFFDNRPGRGEWPGHGNWPGRGDRPGHGGRPGKDDGDRPNRPGKGDSSGHGDRPNLPGDSWGQGNRPNRPDRGDSWGQGNRPNRPGKGDSWGTEGRPQRGPITSGQGGRGRNLNFPSKPMNPLPRSNPTMRGPSGGQAIMRQQNMNQQMQRQQPSMNRNNQMQKQQMPNQKSS